jgi:hypothetical protein
MEPAGGPEHTPSDVDLHPTSPHTPAVAPRAPSPAPLHILPTPPAPENTPSTLRHAVGQVVQPARRAERITAQSMAVPEPPSSGWRRSLVVAVTAIVLGGAVLTAVLWPSGGDTSGRAQAETATIHLELDHEAQIFLDEERQLPARTVDLIVSALAPHTVRVKRGEREQKVKVAPLAAGAVKRLELTLGE